MPLLLALLLAAFPAAIEHDVVLKDFRFASGETLREVRHTSPHTKVVMITGYARDELVNEALTMDVFACLAKPFSVRDVVDMVKLLSESP